MSVPNEGVVWQPNLFEVAGQPDFDRSFANLQRVQLDHESWVDHVPGWVAGSDALFEQILTERGWAQRRRKMYDQKVLEPRLTAPWNVRSGEPLEPPILEDIRQALSERYERDFDSVGFNLYRDGRDSVAWHGDRIKKEIEDPIVALVSVGEARKFLLRPRRGEGGSEHSYWVTAIFSSPAASRNAPGSTAFPRLRRRDPGSAWPTGTAWTPPPTRTRKSSTRVNTPRCPR